MKDTDRIADFVKEVVEKEYSVLTGGQELDDMFFFPVDYVDPADLTTMDVAKMHEAVKAMAEYAIWKKTGKMQTLNSRPFVKYDNVLKALLRGAQHSKISAVSHFIKAALTAQEFTNNPFPDLELPATTSSNLKTINFQEGISPPLKGEIK